MRQKDQIFIFNDEELSLIQNTFAENDILLYTVRKVLLQFPLTETEVGLIKTGVTPEVSALLRKRLLPEISDDFPIGQLSTLNASLTEGLKVKSPEEMAPLFEAKQIQSDYLEQRFTALENIGTPEPSGNIKLSDLGRVRALDAYGTFVNLHAYLFLLGYIDQGLMLIKSLAGQKNETIEEKKKRITRDSAK